MKSNIIVTDKEHKKRTENTKKHQTMKHTNIKWNKTHILLSDKINPRLHLCSEVLWKRWVEVQVSIKFYLTLNMQERGLILVKIKLGQTPIIG